MKAEDIKRIAEEALGADLSDVTLLDGDCISVRIDGARATVCGATLPQKLRGLALYHMHRDEDGYSVTQAPAFDTLGSMIDVSRGGVMRPEKVKEFILRTALAGANAFMLYTEDIFTLEGYPHLGYLRGAYTDGELRSIDDYAASLGVEVIPCIQTLGHMAQYLSWTQETKELRDTDSVLLCDGEQTYRFLDAVIGKMSRIFRSRRIHIGMDEAHDVALGNYLKKFGYRERYSVLRRHLARVTDICQSYGYAPMMWSDMFFRIGSKTSNYYDLDVTFPDELKENMPPVVLVYWAYWNGNGEIYRGMLRRHGELGRRTVFSGSVISCHGPLPIYSVTRSCATTGLDACLSEGVREVFATFWGDDGHECDFFDSLYAFSIFSEKCYDQNASRADVDRMGALISGVSPKLAREIEAFYRVPRSKSLLWGDVFYNLTGIDYAEGEGEGYRFLDGVIADCDDERVRLVLSVLRAKAELYATLLPAYRAKQSLAYFADTLLPHLRAVLVRLSELHGERWLSVYKPFGYEVVQSRFATAIARTEYAIDLLSRYGRGEIASVEELEYEPIFGEIRVDQYAYNAFSRVTVFN